MEKRIEITTSDEKLPQWIIDILDRGDWIYFEDTGSILARRKDLPAIADYLKKNGGKP